METKRRVFARESRPAPKSAGVVPLGTPAPSSRPAGRTRRAQAARADVDKAPVANDMQENARHDEKGVDVAPQDTVISTSMNVAIMPPTQDAAGAVVQNKGTTTMQLKFKNISRNGKTAFYTGARLVLRFPVDAFVNKQPTETLEVQDGVLAGPKAKLSAEERKAQRKAAPKQTDAEKAEALRKRLARLESKLATGTTTAEPGADAQM